MVGSISNSRTFLKTSKLVTKQNVPPKGNKRKTFFKWLCNELANWSDDRKCGLRDWESVGRTGSWLILNAHLFYCCSPIYHINTQKHLGSRTKAHLHFRTFAMPSDQRFPFTYILRSQDHPIVRFVSISSVACHSNGFYFAFMCPAQTLSSHFSVLLSLARFNALATVPPSVGHVDPRIRRT